MTIEAELVVDVCGKIYFQVRSLREFDRHAAKTNANALFEPHQFRVSFFLSNIDSTTETSPVGPVRKSIPFPSIQTAKALL